MESNIVLSKERKEKRQHATKEILKILEGMLLGDAEYALLSAHRQLSSNCRVQLLSPEDE